MPRRIPASIRPLTLAVVIAVLTGCQTSKTPWAWETNFQPRAGSALAPQVAPGAVQVVFFDQESHEYQGGAVKPYDILANNPDVPGMRVLGVSRFREVKEFTENFDRTQFREHAGEMGASTVRIARRMPPNPADRMETRTRVVRSSGPASTPGNIITRGNVGEPTIETTEVEVNVEVFDYIIVYFADAQASDGSTRR